ncbi:hypothetical protein PG988_007918 [Apiospora saccharicola]
MPLTFQNPFQSSSSTACAGTFPGPGLNLTKRNPHNYTLKEYDLKVTCTPADLSSLPTAEIQYEEHWKNAQTVEYIPHHPKPQHSFCPTTRFWHYGIPAPYPGAPKCSKEQECSITTQHSYAFANSTTNGRSWGGSETNAEANGEEWGEDHGHSHGVSVGYSTVKTCGGFYVIPIYYGVCGVIGSSWPHKENWEQWVRFDGKFTCTNYIAKGESNGLDDAHKGRVTNSPQYQAFHTVFVRKDCQTQNFMGPEHQEQMFNDVIIWDDWQEWLLMKNLTSDTLALTTENDNPHHGRWFGYSIVDEFEDEKIVGKLGK